MSAAKDAILETLHSLDFFIVAGPTASGKSDLAVALAERWNGEIVGADAFQVYRGLDILTAKPSREMRARVPHHLIGEIPLIQSFDVGQYLKLAQRRIAEIRSRGRVTFVVGGTGLYLRALTCGLADLPPADANLREALSGKTLEELQDEYSDLDPTGSLTIDRQNPRRLIRAIEVCRLTGRPFSSFREQWREPTAHFRGIACERPREELHARIDRRTELMFEQGVENEVMTAQDIGPTVAQTLGLSEIQSLLRGETTRSSCITAIQQATRRYAKRQMTWLRRETHLLPVDLSTERHPGELAGWLSQSSKT